MKHGWATLAVTLVLVTSACSGTPATPSLSEYNADDPSTWPLAELIEQALIDANANGATAEQVATLENALAEGEVTTAQARSAAEAVRECVIDSGQEATAVSSYNARGVEVFGFTVTSPVSMDMAVADALYQDCETKHRAFIDYVYHQQPTAREALFRELEAHDTELRDCLTAMGGRDIDQLTTSEVWAELKNQSFGGEDFGYSQEVDCLVSVGINW